MAESAITTALSKLAEFMAREVQLMLQLSGEMVLLEDRLQWLLAVVTDADRKRRGGTDGLTRVWVRQTRDVAFATEDVLDNFSYQDHCWKKFCIKYMLTKQIKQIKLRVKQISENQHAYKIEHTPVVTLASSNMTTSKWLDDHFKRPVGFNHDAATLERMLGVDKKGPLKIISIVGEGGIGKTTLAEVIFYKHEVRKNFGIILWYTMQLESNTEVLLQGICRQAFIQRRRQNPSFSTTDDTSDVTAKLRSLLAGETYLMFLGGIRSETILNWLKPRLPDYKNGSRVVLLLDTESEEVARHAENLNGDDKKRMHLLSRLNEERSADLFLSRFLREGAPEYEKENMRTTYGQTVYNITRGHPLAIVLLAGLLRFKEMPSQWDAVLKQIDPGADSGSSQLTGAILSEDPRTAIPATETNLNPRTAIDRIFWASFDDLPSDLKSCYLYFAVFAKNTFQVADTMVRMWIAEGFIKPRVGKTMEEQGHDYLNELVSRYLVHVLWRNDRNGILGVRMHTRLHGFLESEAREAGFVEIRGPQDVFVPPSVRRLSFQSYDGRYNMVSNDLPKLRSFVCRVVGADKSRGSTEVNKEKGKAEAGASSSGTPDDKNTHDNQICGLLTRWKPNPGDGIEDPNKQEKDETGAMELGTGTTEGHNHPLLPKEETEGGGKPNPQTDEEIEERKGKAEAGASSSVTQDDKNNNDANDTVKGQHEIEEVVEPQSNKAVVPNPNPTNRVASPGGKPDDENANQHYIKFLHGPVCCGFVKRRCRSKFLRVISIVGLNLVKLPEGIDDLNQLRYLLVDSKNLKNLPSSIKGLLNLQTLDIGNTKVETIDPGFWKIAGLRHILAEDLTLPPSIEKELDELQTLHGVKPAQGLKWHAENFPLKKMANLRSVELHGFDDNTHGAALKSALSNMVLVSHLKLNMKEKRIPSCIFTGQGLQFLQTIVLEGGEEWPPVEVFKDLRIARPNLLHLRLKDTKHPSEDIQSELKNNFTSVEHGTVYKVSYKIKEAEE